jgi:hypothetical protein
MGEPIAPRSPVARRPLATALLLAWAGLSAACGQAGAVEAFTLDEHDKLIAEAPGCYVECQVTGPGRRSCTIRERDCRAACQSVPECKPDGVHMLKVCAVVKEGR